MTRCYEWNGVRDSKGYGLIKPHWSKKHKKATHFIWEITKGKMPEGMQVLHKCDNPPCFNPRHLFLGTPLDNMNDMARKGRGVYPRGEKHGKSRYKIEIIRKVIQLYNDEYTQTQISRELNMPWTTVHDIIRGKTWSHVTAIHETN